MTELADFQNMEEFALQMLREDPVRKHAFLVIPQNVRDYVGDCVSQAIAPSEDSPLVHAFSAGSLFLVQMLQDYRACELLARLTYVGAACSVAASIYESFYIFDSIMHEPAKAKLWLESLKVGAVTNSQLKQNPIGYGDARDAFYRGIFANDSKQAELSKEESRAVYTHLSAFKHHHPVARSKFGIIPDETAPEGLRLWPFPSPDIVSIGVAAFALESASKQVAMSAGSYLHVFGDQRTASEFPRQIEHLINNIEAAFLPLLTEGENS